MMRSMFAAISGLKNHQTFMDVVGNNIANVNTTGFKQSRVTFQDILSQTVRGPSGPQGGRGGVNPEQVGLGVLISGIDTIQTQGTLQSTGKLTDMAIQGDGYFVMSDGKQNFFSRDGAFDLGIDGTLVNPSTGLHVMGWNTNPTTGLIDSSVPPTNLNIPVGAGMTGKASTSLTTAGNLDSNTAAGAANAVPLSVTVYDSQGNAIPLTLTFTKNGPNTWSVVPTSTSTLVQSVTGGGPLVFNGAGRVQSGSPASLLVNLNTANDGSTTPMSLSLDMSQITQLASTPSAPRRAR
jgi:flagellar hook protein FlgE